MKVNIIMAIIVLFVFSFVFYLINLYKYKEYKKNHKAFNSMEIRFLLARNRLLKEDLLKQSFFITISTINAFIIALVFLVIEYVPLNLMFRLMIGFVLLMALIYSLYGILGTILEKRYNK